MTRLELVKRLVIDAGISNSGPSTTLNQKGEYAQAVNWIDEAYMLIENMHSDWGWLRNSVSFTTVDQQATYTLASIGLTNDIADFVIDSFKVYTTADGPIGEKIILPVTYDYWKNALYFSGGRSNISEPYNVAISPKKEVCLWPAPLAGYTITADYFAAHNPMTADADVPLLPKQYHMLILYRAMMLAGAYHADPDVERRGTTEFYRLLSSVTAHRMPMVHVSYGMG